MGMAIHPDHPHIDQRKLAVANCCSRLLPIVGLALLFLGIFGKNPPINMGKTWSIITITTGSIFTVVFSCLRGCFCLAMRERRREDAILAVAELRYGRREWQREQAILDDAAVNYAVQESLEEQPVNVEEEAARMIQEGVTCLKELYLALDDKGKSDFLKFEGGFVNKLAQLVVARFITGDKSHSTIPSFFKPQTRQGIQALREAIAKNSKIVTEQELQNASGEELRGVLVKQCWWQAVNELMPLPEATSQ